MRAREPHAASRPGERTVGNPGRGSQGPYAGEGRLLPVLGRSIALDDMGIQSTIAVQQPPVRPVPGPSESRKGKVIFWKVMVLVLRPGIFVSKAWLVNTANANAALVTIKTCVWLS